MQTEGGTKKFRNTVGLRDCPAGFDLCYPSFKCQDCMFWRNNRCDYKAITAQESVDAEKDAESGR